MYKLFAALIIAMVLAVPAVAAPVVPWMDAETITMVEWSTDGESITLISRTAFDEDWFVGDILPLPIVPDFIYGEVRYAGLNDVFYTVKGRPVKVSEALSSIIGVEYILDDVWSMLVETRDIDHRFDSDGDSILDSGQFVGVKASHSRLPDISDNLATDFRFYWGGGSGYDLVATLNLEGRDMFVGTCANYRFSQEFNGYGNWEIEVGKNFLAKNISLSGYYLDSTRHAPVYGMRIYYIPGE